jgi:hypothetical protein
MEPRFSTKTGGQTDMTKLMLGFRKFATVTKIDKRDVHEKLSGHFRFSAIWACNKAHCI